jgi:hypothetical protein
MGDYELAALPRRTLDFYRRRSEEGMLEYVEDCLHQARAAASAWVEITVEEPESDLKTERLKELRETERWWRRRAHRERVEWWRSWAKSDKRRAVRRSPARLVERNPARALTARKSSGRRVVQVSSTGPPDRPRPSSGDDDPPHDDVIGSDRWAA